MQQASISNQCHTCSEVAVGPAVSANWVGAGCVVAGCVLLPLLPVNFAHHPASGAEAGPEPLSDSAASEASAGLQIRSA